MIISNLTGGLGNQMFQYSLGRHLALKNKTLLKLHFTNALLCTAREYSLNCFNIEAEIATDEDIKNFGFPTTKAGRVILRIKKELRLFKSSKIITERKTSFDSSILNLPNNVYLEGFWQNEKYFKDIEGQIRKDFTFKTKPSRKNFKLIKEIKNSNSVSIHVRRKDYLKYKEFQICDIDYYYKAIDIIKKKIKYSVFFIFSDDINWCKDNLLIKDKTFYVRNNKPCEDIKLMSLCKHNIIANSSFSWWGAWLNINKNKIIIGPRKWTKRDNTNRLPENWLNI